MRVMNTDIFIKKASIKHNRFYSYDKSEFISNKTKIIISCPIHGDFLQTPNNHLSGYKCMKCSVDSRSKKRMDNKFIERSIKKFNNKFDYSLVEYKNNATNIILKCNIHGIFSITPSIHLKSKTGCPKCSTYNTSQLQKLDVNSLIEKFKDIHNDKYEYHMIKYKNNKEKIEIICKKHGIFKQSAKQHLRGQGCPNCIISTGEFKIKNLLLNNNIKFKQQYCFDDCKFVNKLKFDFYLPTYNICIEFDGIQHYYPLIIFGGEKEFNKQIIKDNIKNQYCKTNNINLYRIKYNDNIEEKINCILNDI